MNKCLNASADMHICFNNEGKRRADVVACPCTAWSRPRTRRTRRTRDEALAILVGNSSQESQVVGQGECRRSKEVQRSHLCPGLVMEIAENSRTLVELTEEMAEMAMFFLFSGKAAGTRWSQGAACGRLDAIPGSLGVLGFLDNLGRLTFIMRNIVNSCPQSVIDSESYQVGEEASLPTKVPW